MYVHHKNMVPILQNLFGEAPDVYISYQGYHHFLINQVIPIQHGTIQGPVIFGWIFSAHQFGAAFAAYGAGLARDSLLTYLPVFIWAGIACFVATVLIFIFKKINISFAA